MNIVQSNVQFDGLLSYGNKPQLIILHHAEASSCSVADIHRWHLDRGWVGIGYHYFVRKDGTIYTGRPENAIGAHCPGVNAKSIGICAEGAYTREQMPIEQLVAITELVASLCNKYNISSDKVKGHRDVPYPTNCPGDNYPKEQIVSGITAPVILPTPTPVQPKVAEAYRDAHPDAINQGDNGQAVVDLQTKLISLGYNLGKWGADGDFGATTLGIVKSFQSVMGITQDGIVGPKTMSVLNEVASKPTLRQGSDYNFAVRFLQSKLGILVDGDFGPGTYKAVVAFQKKKRLSADGVVGTNTWKAIIA